MSDWKLVSTGGKVTLSDAASGGNVLMDGTGIEDCSLSVRRTNGEFRAQEMGSSQKLPGPTEYRITLNRGLEDTRIAGQTSQNVAALVTAERLFTGYKDANGVTLFSGWCSWEDATDTQRALDAARNSMNLMNIGDPVIPAADADPATWPYALA